MKQWLTLLSFVVTLVACSSLASPKDTQQTLTQSQTLDLEPLNTTNLSDKFETATFGGGCFWCVEAVFLMLKGVQKVESGYAGGQTLNPTYDDICTGTTGHAEVIQITFDPSQIGFADLVEIFFNVHDPTQLNRQGADVGTQYRSVVFYHNEEQKKATDSVKTALQNANLFGKPIVTEVSPLTKFYKAEAYHQNYYNRNPEQGYCSYVISPKIQKFKKQYNQKLK
ncbi:MAG: peptide-methionine (S)-S-oxide reductase [Cytophagales bacterium]|nr:MAG: peptide-methionine (S)-S-oxide reductase [Cytophagales bacterium]TAF60557.1 MAG: peptide-methionine (S)-S-oxide reductase [Cytophagales bacterium]